MKWSVTKNQQIKHDIDHVQRNPLPISSIIILHEVINPNSSFLEFFIQCQNEIGFPGFISVHFYIIIMGQHSCEFMNIKSCKSSFKSIEYSRPSFLYSGFPFKVIYEIYNLIRAHTYDLRQLLHFGQRCFQAGVILKPSSDRAQQEQTYATYKSWMNSLLCFWRISMECIIHHMRVSQI